MLRPNMFEWRVVWTAKIWPRCITILTDYFTVYVYYMVPYNTSSCSYHYGKSFHNKCTTMAFLTRINTKTALKWFNSNRITISALIWFSPVWNINVSALIWCVITKKSWERSRKLYVFTVWLHTNASKSLLCTLKNTLI